MTSGSRGLVGQLLDQMVAGTALKSNTRKPRDGYGQWFYVDRDEVAESWKVA